MSAFELVYLFNETTGVLGAELDTFLTILFAFVVGAYMAAKRMTKTMRNIAIGLFTGACFMNGFAINRTASDMADLAQEIRKVANQEGSALEFHAFADQPVILMATLPWLMTVLMIAAYIASIFFFFHVRNTTEMKDNK